MNSFWNPPVAPPSEKALMVELAAGFEGVEPVRISNLLMDQLCYSYTAEGASDMHHVLDAIKAVEGTGSPRQTATPREFKHQPLKGLWKVHYFTARFMAQNLINECYEPQRQPVLKDDATRIMKPKHRARVDDVLRSEMTPAQKANQIAHNMVMVPYKERSDRNALTGEWVIYAKDASDQNHYLVAAEHNAGDQAIYDLIRSRCEQRFLALLPLHQEHLLGDSIDNGRQGG